MQLYARGRRWGWLVVVAGCGLLLYLASPSLTQTGNGKKDVGKTSYDQIAPVILGETTFAEVLTKDKAAKAGIMARQKALLEERYALSKSVDPKVKMTRGKPIPVGPTIRLP